MTSNELDAIRLELAEIQDKLLELPRDAFAERVELRDRQAELRDAIAGQYADRDERRSDTDLLRELESLRKRRKEIVRNRINLVGQSSGGEGGGPGAGSIGIGNLNRQMDEAQGGGDIEARIMRIESILTDRGVALPPL